VSRRKSGIAVHQALAGHHAQVAHGWREEASTDCGCTVQYTAALVVPLRSSSAQEEIGHFGRVLRCWKRRSAGKV
jgi:hypothetical protein